MTQKLRRLALAQPRSVPAVVRDAGRIAGGAVLLLASTIAASGGRGETLHLRCTNPYSGTNWPIVVDLGAQRVDTFPAEISETWISWRDPAEGSYDLERATGKLQLRNASSTGGYFLHYICRAE